MRQPQIEFLDHTADVGLTVRADTLAELFRGAADGMFQLTLGEAVAPPNTTAAEERTVYVQAEDAAMLLAGWLRELLYIHQAEQLRIITKRFDTLTEHELAATIMCGPCPAQQLEIKAVTYHQLSVAREDGAWLARVIFDV
jgi:SHS2 domain-containing protein